MSNFKINIVICMLLVSCSSDSTNDLSLEELQSANSIATRVNLAADQ